MGEHPTPILEIPAVAAETIDTLERELGCSDVLAQALARRGLDDPAAARAFLEASEAHRPAALRGIADAVALILGHIERGSQITVHGDYDCDGVCATAILLGVLRELGADADFHLPDRLGDGYGLAGATVERLAARGTSLLITADCAITAVEQVAQARAAGIDVLVTDHHAPREDGVLPDAPYVHPALCGYPCAELCATAVAAKLSQALREAAGLDAGERAGELELVALATIADVMALRGENRRLVREGLRALSSTVRPGLRALMRVARVEPLRLDERAVGFRLAPRLNAAGRLYRADAALELLTTDDPDRAAALAQELDRANAERRDVETRIRFEAEALVSAAGPAPAYVLAAQGWHPGVTGIVAARIARRHHRPAILIALPDDPGELASGSGRSIPAFDLLGGLRASASHLVRHGGHRAAAGLTIEPARVDAFRAAFLAHAAGVLAPADLVPRERVDAVASGEQLGIALAEELRALAPFGAGNPELSLLLAAATFSDAVGFGGERRDQHARFTVSSGGGRARAVHFGAGPRPPVDAAGPVDAAFSLELNEWRGVVEPRLVLRAAVPSSPAPIELLGEDGGYLERALAELERPLEPPAPDGSHPTGVDAAATVHDRRGRGIASQIAQLVATGEPLLVVVADAQARRRHLEGRLGGFALAAHDALERGAADPARYRHLLLLDPPARARGAERLAAAAPGARTVMAWGPAELRFAEHIHEHQFGLRDPLSACWRALRDRGGAAGRELEEVLRGDASQPRPPELAGRLLRVLAETGLIELDRERVTVTVTERRRVSLESSPAFREYERRRQDGLRSLRASIPQAA